MFDQLSGLKKDLNFFCELRATTQKRVLEKMGIAGVSNIQIGIESLSSRLLKKLNKETTAIQICKNIPGRYSPQHDLSDPEVPRRHEITGKTVAAG